MDRAERLRTSARSLLFLAALTCAVGMVGPFQGVEKHLISPDKAAHFSAFYGLTLLLFSAFPDRRRTDLVALAVFAGSGIEVVQMLTGRDAEIGDVMADALGSLAVYVPVWLEWARRPRVERRQPVTLAAPAPTWSPTDG